MPTSVSAAWGAIAVAGAEWGPVALRALVVLTSATLAGLALLRPVIGPPRPVVHRVLLGTAAVAAAGTLLSVPVHGAVATLAALQAALVAGTALLLPRPRAAVACGTVLAAVLAYETVSGSGVAARAAGAAHTVAAAIWLGTAAAVALAERGTRSRMLRRLAPWVLGAGAVVVVTGLAGVWLDGLRPDAASTGSAFGRVVLAKALLVVVAVAAGVTVRRRRATRRASRLGLTALAAAVVAGSALAVLPVPPAPPVAGVPLLRTVALGDETVPVAVVPQRPGRNLVHVGAHGTHALSVGTDPAGLLPVTARPGTRGGWAVVSLPAGASRLWVGHDDTATALRVDTGGTPSPVDAALAGPDGAECASAALGALVAGSAPAVTSCPADRLTGEDAAVLRQTVDFLAARAVRSLGLVADSSPRARAAAALVRATAAAHRVAVAAGPAPSGVQVVVAGWERADAMLRRLLTGATPVGGVYLAPWLATGGLLQYSSGAVVALRFDPHGWPARQYVAALDTALPGEAPSASGFAAWRTARHERPGGPTLLYAAAQVSYLPAELGHGHTGGGWVVGGRLTAVTAPLG
jgi:putative copper export protein